MSKQKKPKKDKQPFWKRPELKSIADHIGKTADNMKFNDWADLAIMGGLAYLSWQTWGTVTKISESPRGPGMGGVGGEITEYYPWTLMIGPIGYKLATTMGGTPPISQITGVSILTALGMAQMPGMLGPPKPGDIRDICDKIARFFGL